MLMPGFIAFPLGGILRNIICLGIALITALITGFVYGEIILGGSTVGSMIVAFPVAAALFRKGARLSVIFTYLGAAAVCRIPMTIFESSYLGVRFTIVRYCVALPLIIISSVLMDRILNRLGYVIQEE